MVSLKVNIGHLIPKGTLPGAPAGSAQVPRSGIPGLLLVFAVLLAVLLAGLSGGLLAGGCSQSAHRSGATIGFVGSETEAAAGNVWSPAKSSRGGASLPMIQAQAVDENAADIGDDDFGDEEFGDDDFGDDEFDDFGDEFAAELDQEFAANETADIEDPFSGYNRAMTAFNDKLYLWVLQPAGKGFRFVLPLYVRQGIDNFFDNLFYPIRLVNNLLQAKFSNSGEATLRSTIGILGLWDPADKWFGLEAHDEDFGQTLGYWGVGPGPHIVLPFLGPSNLRDSFALVPDIYLNPLTYLVDTKTQLALRVFAEVNEVSLHIGEYENLKRDALDLYPFLREVYEQHRAQKILE